MLLFQSKPKPQTKPFALPFHSAGLWGDGRQPADRQQPQSHTHMKTSEAKATIKAINRWVRRYRPFEGGLQFGVDYPTWSTCYPQVARTVNRAAEMITGKSGNYMPIFR